jgi:RNA polymerase sigma-70 factor, ECF subfamily
LTDQELIAKYLSGDIVCFNTLVWRWEKQIYNFVYRYLSDPDLTKDVTQRVFIRIYKNLKTLKDHAKFSSWIYQIAVNLCKDELKRLKKRTPISIEYIKETNSENNYRLIEDDSVSPESTLNNNQMGQLIQKALQLIPEEQRVVIIMKEYQGLKFIEIAEALGEPLNTVKSRLYYGLKALRKIFDKWQISQEVIQYEM